MPIKHTPSVSHSVYSKRSQGFRVKTSTQDDVVYTVTVIPPDGGWGWLVVFTSFAANFAIDGSIFCFGIFLDDISKDLNVLPTRVAFVNSIMVSLSLLAAPIICGLTNKYGFRIVALLGALFTASSFVASSFLHNIYAFYVVCGLIGGFFLAMYYVPAVVVVGFYFERWRALATSISVCGSSVGIITFPLILSNLMKNYDWRWKFRAIAILFVVVGFGSLTYRPLMPVTVAVAPDNEDSIISVVVDGSQAQTYSGYHNLKYPTTADIQDIAMQAQIPFNLQPDVSSSSTFIATSVPTIPGGSATVSRMSTLFEDERGRKQGCCKRLVRCLKRCCRNPFKKNQMANRPMYRDDIFFAGSMYTIPEYTKHTGAKQGSVMSKFSRKSAVDYHLSVSRVATQKDVEEDEKHFVCCPEALKRILATMLDCNLLKLPSFICLTFYGFIVSLGMYVPFIYIINKAGEDDMDPIEAPMFVTGLGVTNLVGRIMVGILASIPKVNPVAITYTGLFLSGIPTIAFAFAKKRWMYYVYIGFFGSGIAVVPTTKTVVIVNLYGLEKLTNAFGITLLFQGLSCFFGLIIAGLIIEYFGSYNAGFIFSGCTIILGGILLIPVSRIRKWETKKEQKKEREKQNRQNKLRTVR